MPGISEYNKGVVRRAFEAWRSGNGSVFDLMTPDATWTIVGNTPVSRTYRGKSDFMDTMIKPFNARLSTRLVPTAPTLYGDADTVIAYFSAQATARDGRPYRNTYTWYLQLRDDQIVNAIAFFDTVDFNDLWNRVAA